MRLDENVEMCISPHFEKGKMFFLSFFDFLVFNDTAKVLFIVSLGNFDRGSLFPSGNLQFLHTNTR